MRTKKERRHEKEVRVKKKENFGSWLASPRQWSCRGPVSAVGVLLVTLCDGTAKAAWITPFGV